jgi:hypothetical protein
VSAMRVFVAHRLPATASLGRVPPKASDGSSDSRGLVLVVSAESSQETLMRCGWASCCHAATSDSHTCTARRTSRTGRLCTMRKGPAWSTRAVLTQSFVSGGVKKIPNEGEKESSTLRMEGLEGAGAAARRGQTEGQEEGVGRVPLHPGARPTFEISYERNDGAFARRTQPNLCYFPFPK